MSRTLVKYPSCLKDKTQIYVIGRNDTLDLIFKNEKKTDKYKRLQDDKWTKDVNSVFLECIKSSIIHDDQKVYAYIQLNHLPAKNETIDEIILNNLHNDLTRNLKKGQVSEFAIELSVLLDFQECVFNAKKKLINIEGKHILVLKLKKDSTNEINKSLLSSIVTDVLDQKHSGGKFLIKLETNKRMYLKKFKNMFAPCSLMKSLNDIRI